MNHRKRALWAAAATAGAAIASAVGLTVASTVGGSANAAATGQSYAVPCPALPCRRPSHTRPEHSVPSPKGTPGGGLPVGAGFRVPAWIVSPWTVGGRIFSEVSDHTSGLQLIEAVTAAGGLSGHGPVTFPAISTWRRKTFGDFTRGLRFGALQTAPSNTQFDPATTAANLAAQQTAAKQPMPPRPGATQSFPFPRL